MSVAATARRRRCHRGTPPPSSASRRRNARDPPAGTPVGHAECRVRCGHGTGAPRGEQHERGFFYHRHYEHYRSRHGARAPRDLRESRATTRRARRHRGPQAHHDDTIDRAIRCLEEVQTRSAWTTPSDPRLRLEQHIATLVTSALSQFIRDYLPDEELSSLTFDFHRHTIAVHLAGEPRLRRIILTPDSRYLDPTEPLPELYREGRRRSR